MTLDDAWWHLMMLDDAWWCLICNPLKYHYRRTDRRTDRQMDGRTMLSIESPSWLETFETVSIFLYFNTLPWEEIAAWSESLNNFVQRRYIPGQGKFSLLECNVSKTAVKFDLISAVDDELPTYIYPDNVTALVGQFHNCTFVR